MKVQEQIKVIQNQTQHTDLMNAFLKMQRKPYLYFKWQPSICGLKLIKSDPFISTKTLRLYESDASFNLEKLKNLMEVQPVSEIVRKVAGNQEMFSYAIPAQNQPWAYIFLSEKNIYIQHLIQFLKLKHECLFWKKRSGYIKKNEDFLKTLFSEVFRARALCLPVSLIVVRCVSLDGVHSYNENYELSSFFKSLNHHLLKNMSPYDSISQINKNELGCILPHTSLNQAVESAKKISWILNSINYSKIFSIKKSIYFQVGVAEYPSMCRDAVDLLKMGRSSSYYSSEENDQEKGRVCVACPVEGFKPDFQAKDFSKTI